MTSNDPWSDIPKADPTGGLMGRRIDASIPWDMFWARDREGRPTFYMSFEGASTPAGTTPRLKGVDVHMEAHGQRGALILTLLDLQATELFRDLCLNVVEGTRSVAHEREATAIALARTWRWHHLLRGASSQLLSAQRQQGLIAEIRFMHSMLLPRLGALDSVSAWRGPLDAPKDFELSRVAIEVKARRGAASPFVSISSEYQLDGEGCDLLMLAVLEVTGATARDEDGRTLTEIAGDTRTALERDTPAAMEPFDGLLEAAGFTWSDDYSHDRWTLGELTVYEVRDDFPRLVTGNLDPGISNVKYSLSLPSISIYRVDDYFLDALLSGGSDVQGT